MDTGGSPMTIQASPTKCVKIQQIGQPPHSDHTFRAGWGLSYLLYLYAFCGGSTGFLWGNYSGETPDLWGPSLAKAGHRRDFEHTLQEGLDGQAQQWRKDSSARQ